MNYIGCKNSLMNFLIDTIEKVAGKDYENKVFADLFAGTGIVGSTFKSLGYKVIANDIQYYSYCLNKHYIENIPPINDNLFDFFNSLKGIDGFIFENYCPSGREGRNYFTDENGRKCDSIRLKLESLYRNNEITENEYFYYLASLINSIDKYANTASVYGAFLKKFKKTATKTLALEPLDIINGKKGKVYNRNISDIISKIEGDILYLDPPYNIRQYCTNYHVLETIALYDKPILHGKTGLRNYTNQKSDFCSKKTVKQAFEHIILNAKFKYIFLSYNNEGLMSLNETKTIMEKYGKYELFTKEYRRFRADKEQNRNHKANSTIEYLHCLIKY